jgi:hypothetical protein
VNHKVFDEEPSVETIVSRSKAAESDILASAFANVLQNGIASYSTCLQNGFIDYDDFNVAAPFWNYGVLLPHPFAGTTTTISRKKQSFAVNVVHVDAKRHRPNAGGSSLYMLCVCRFAFSRRCS